MTDIPLNAKVQCSDEACGKTTNVILNPVTRQVTHIVLKDKSLGDNQTRMVPVENVAIPVSAVDLTDEKTVYLNIDKKAVGALPAVKVKR